VPGGYVFVDGLRVGEVGPAVMKDRELLARDGIVIVNAVYDRERQALVGDMEIVTRGFVFEPEAGDLLDAARQTARRVIMQHASTNNRKNDLVQDALNKLFYSETRRRPVVFAFVNEV
jgi:ribonuclease J